MAHLIPYEQNLKRNNLSQIWEFQVKCFFFLETHLVFAI